MNHLHLIKCQVLKILTTTIRESSLPSEPMARFIVTKYIMYSNVQYQMREQNQGIFRLIISNAIQLLVRLLAFDVCLFACY